MERLPYWQINGGILIDLLALPAIFIFCYGFYLHWQKLQKGTLRFRMDVGKIKAALHREAIVRFLWGGILGSRLYQEPGIGIFHGLTLGGILVLFLGTLMVFLNVFFGVSVMAGPFYKWFMAFALDLAGVLALFGLGFFFIRRLSGIPRLITPKPRKGFFIVEGLLAAVLVTGFLVEGFRIHLTDAHEIAFIGEGIARMLRPIDGGTSVYVALWWVHGVMALTLIAYIPFSPLTHLFFIPVNAVVADPLIGADPATMNFSAFDGNTQGEPPAFGVSTLADYPPKRLLDFSTCVWCGRCQEVCPATQTQKSLTPKGVMVTLAEWLHHEKMADPALLDTIGMKAVFECRTCGACVERCPAFVNPLRAIWHMRQNWVMERGEMPPNMVQAYKNMEAFRHPFSASTPPQRWREGLDVPEFIGKETEYLLWIGCAVIYEDRAQQIGRAMVRLLNQAGISYGVLEETRCTGDPAKQMGDDYLFSELANTNIALFKERNVKKIITLCPHCYHSFKHYYPPLGGDYEVIPHVVLIHDLMESEKIHLPNSGRKITFHDPCYLGRHTRIFDRPRNILNKLGRLVEMPRNRNKSFCCGAGGGTYWNEEEGTRINYARAKEAFESGTDIVASACPFCLLMLTDGMKMVTDDKKVFDIAELIENSLAEAPDHGGLG